MLLIMATGIPVLQHIIIKCTQRHSLLSPHLIQKYLRRIIIKQCQIFGAIRNYQVHRETTFDVIPIMVLCILIIKARRGFFNK